MSNLFNDMLLFLSLYHGNAQDGKQLHIDLVKGNFDFPKDSIGADVKKIMQQIGVIP